MGMAFVKLFLILLVYVRCSVSASHHRRHSLDGDKAALLAFKKSVLVDPESTLANWGDDVHVCNFTGVTCNRQHHRVTQIDLSSSGLVARIPPFLSNLTALRVLNLYDNHFFGTIPPEISSLRHLRTIVLNRNNLNGSIPDSFALLTGLTVFDVMENNLTGPLPPSFFSNCTQLKVIDLSFNDIRGRIPVEIGNCPGLWTLSLYNNQFTGQLPPSLTNTTLYNLDVEYNLLSGELPSDLVSKLPTLVFIHLSYNNMKSHGNNTDLDPFFATLGNCTGLMELELAGMGLGGRLPSSIGHPNLKRLELQENSIFGSIPPEIGNLSNITMLNLTSNFLNGTIPEEFSLLLMLERLFLSRNLFNIRIPSTLGKLPHLGLLDLSNNRFDGEIPASLGDLVALRSLFLNNNLLSGTIPRELLKCSNLYMLDLSYNKLQGRIPQELNEIREIRGFINLSHNFLEGPLPIELSKLENVEEIDLSSNNLNGNIFPQISSCIAVKMINFSYNSLEGQLPESLGDLKNLEAFDVSNNSITGNIPMSLSKINLTFLNLSYNNFEGMVPSGGIFDSATHMSFLGNPRLCGAASSRPSCPHTKHWFRSRTFLVILIVVIVVSVLLSAGCCVIGIRRVKLMVSSSKNGRLRKPPTPDIMHNFPRITHKELSNATAGFTDRNLIGTGAGNGGGAIENMGNSTANMLTGSIGYIAPEYGFGSNTSIQGDVYSFGVIVLEMVTRKRPTDDMFTGGLSLHRWVKNHYHGRVEKVVDSSLIRASMEKSPEVKRMWEVAIAELIELGILCTQETPSTRPTMLDAADDLGRLKRYLSGDTTVTFASSLGISSSTIGDH
ncbi:hypothetical protein V6N13_063167 [Hibiscus sabdariffa]